jgi:hypothetical protein
MNNSTNGYFRVQGNFDIKTGQSSYLIHRLENNKIVEKGVGGLSWKFSQYVLAEAFCNKLNEQLNEKVGK